MPRTLFRTGAAAGFLAFLLACPATLLLGQFRRVDPAQQPYPPRSSGDLPGASSEEQFDPADAQHGVARISLLTGEVNVQRIGSAGTVAAAINAPLLTNDRLETGNRSSAEIQLGAATVIRVAENTDLGFGSLEAGSFQAQLGAGTVIFRVLQSTQLAGELDTPNIAIRPLAEADLRVSVQIGGTTQIDVRSGEAEIAGPAGTERLFAGHSYEVRGNPDNPEFQEISPAPRDAFDDWSAARDQELAQSQSAQYVGPDVPGAADLDANGSWVPSSEYGQVWTPSGVGANWAPYSDGQWAYQDYYGWTWVDRASWGWAPYHYGRWFHNGSYGWCWWPGPRLAVNYWRPAVVGFVGWGGGYRGLGWAPLAPHERFRPWWGSRGLGYRAQPFGYGNSSILASYRNAGYRGGVTFAAYNNFAGPGQRFSHLSRRQLAGAAVLGGRVLVVPNRSSYRYSQRQAFSIGQSGNYHRQSFVSSQRLGGFASRPISSGAVSRRTPSAGSPARSASRWQRFGDPGSPGAYRQGFTGNSYTGNDGGWHQFGRPVPSANSAQRNRPAPGRQDFAGRGALNQRQSRSGSNAPQRFSSPSRSGGERRGTNGGTGGGRSRGHR